jgi:flavin-dependent dehydrogenase
VTTEIEERYDIVIIGARCAGATLAALAGRAGARVLLADQAALPSDLVLSTHTLHPSGARVLTRLGLGPRLRALAPAIHTLRIGRGDATLDVRFAADDAEYCPRRRSLDGLLLESACEAGAVVAERTRAIRLERTGERVTGVVFADRTGRERRVRAGLVVGADGRDSFVARAVRAREYLAYPAPRAIYWSYWPAPRGYGADPAQPGMYVANRAGSVHMVFHTEQAHVLVGTAPARDSVAAFRSAPLQALRADVASDALLAQLTSGAPSEKVRGYIPDRYFFREPVGPGWLLLGDAGITQEFVTGNGMTEALQHTEAAARALLGGHAALARWWRERDLAALPMYLFGQLSGALGAPSRLEQRVIAHAARTPALAARFAQSLTGERSPLAVVSPFTAAGLALAGAARGELGLVLDFLRRARQGGEHARLLRRHQALLDACDAGLASVAGADGAPGGVTAAAHGSAPVESSAPTDGTVLGG